MDDLKLGDVKVGGKMNSGGWLNIELNSMNNDDFYISSAEARKLIPHLAAVFDIDLKLLKKDNEI